MVRGEIRREVRAEVSSLLRGAWREPGFCVPNADTYPHQWLWDSCFHAVVWSWLGSDRGVAEVATALSRQAADGFVPHMIYWDRPDHHAGFWGRPGASTITQPPMYGHALAEAARRGLTVPDELVERARLGLVHLGGRPRTPGGLVPVFHPWETGCDDSSRWDDHFADCGPDRRARKAELVEALLRAPEGHAIGSDRFAVGSVGFNALVAWNAIEIADTFPRPDDPLIALAADLTAAVEARWRGHSWIDDRSGPIPENPAAGREEGERADRERIDGDRGVPGADGDPLGTPGPTAVPPMARRTLDTMTALLVDPRPEGFEALVDPEAFGAPFGPRGVHRREVCYQPDRYWRGPAWPQLGYLLMIAAERAGLSGTTRLLADRLVAGARRSGYAEYWHPDTGAGLGARPQSWAGLALPAAARLS